MTSCRKKQFETTLSPIPAFQIHEEKTLSTKITVIWNIETMVIRAFKHESNFLWISRMFPRSHVDVFHFGQSHREHYSSISRAPNKCCIHKDRQYWREEKTLKHISKLTPLNTMRLCYILAVFTFFCLVQFTVSRPKVKSREFHKRNGKKTKVLSFLIKKGANFT